MRAKNASHFYAFFTQRKAKLFLCARNAEAFLRVPKTRLSCEERNTPPFRAEIAPSGEFLLSIFYVLLIFLKFHRKLDTMRIVIYMRILDANISQTGEEGSPLMTQVVHDGGALMAHFKGQK